MSVGGYSWWPDPTGPGAISGHDLSNLQSSFGALTNAGGPAYLPSPAENWPFAGSSSQFRLMSLEWPDTESFTIQEMNATAYNQYKANDDQRLLSKLRMWSFFIDSIDSSSEGYNASSQLLQNAPELFGAVSSLPQNQGIAMVFDTPIPVSGLLMNHVLTLSNLSYSYGSGTGQKNITASDILQSYRDSWENAYQYWRLQSRDKDIWWDNNPLPEVFRPFVVVAHASSGFVDKIKALNSPIDLLSPMSGLQKTNSGIVWNQVRSLAAEGDDFWNLDYESNNFEWFRLGISQGDNFTGVDTETRAWYPATRKWAPEAAAGRYSEGYAGTISNGNVDSETPLIDCLAIVPLFAAYPEVYQCLTQTGPVWEEINEVKTTLTTQTINGKDYEVYDWAVPPEQRERLGYRKMVLQNPVETLTVEKMFLQTVIEGRKMALPGAGLPAAGLQYAINVSGSVSAFLASASGTIWPNGQVNSTYPTHHVKLYNILDRGEGFAHSYSLRQSFVATDWGMGLLFGSGTGSLIGTLEGMAVGQAFTPKQVMWLGVRPSLKSINNALMVWNPKSTEAENSTAIHVSEVAIGPNRPSVIADDDLPETKGKVITEITSENGEGLATWAIWPQSFSNSGGLDGTKFITRGLTKLRFRAKTNIPQSKGSVFIEFRFYAVDIAEIAGISNTEQLMNSIKGSRKDTDLIDNSVLGQYEFLLRLYNDGGLETMGPGREFTWKPLYTPSGLSDGDNDPFETIRAASNEVYSPALDIQYQDIVMNLFLDDFANPTNVNSKLAGKIIDGSDMGLGAHAFNAENIAIFVNARVKSVINEAISDPIQVSLDLSAMDFSFPAKTLEGNFIGFEQRFYNSFNPASGGGNTAYDGLRMFLPASLAEDINNSTTNVYDFQWKGYPELTSMVQLSPFNSSTEVPKMGLRALGISGGRVNQLSDEEWIKVLKSRNGSYFITSPYIMDYTLIAGGKDINWYLDLDVQEIVQPTSGRTNDSADSLLAYYSLLFVDESNNIITLKQEGLARGTSDNLPIGPLVSDITFMSSGYLLLKVVLAVDSPGLTDDPAIVYVNPSTSGIRHEGSIRKIIMTGPLGDVQGGKHIAWFRGLTIGNFDSSQDMTYIMEANSETGWALPNSDFVFYGVVRSPTIKARMARPYAWVLEYEGVGLSEPRVALIKDSAGVDSEKLSLSMTTNDGNNLDLMSSDNLTSDVAMFKLSANSEFLDTINMNIDGEQIQGKETAIAQSSRAASNAKGTQTSRGALVGIGAEDDDGDYIRTAAYSAGLYPAEANM